MAYDAELLVLGQLLPQVLILCENKVQWHVIGGHWSSASQQNLRQRKEIYLLILLLNIMNYCYYPYYYCYLYYDIIGCTPPDKVLY